LVTVRGTSFGIHANPTTLTVLPGETASFNITVTSLYGFVGAVTLAPSPYGFPATLDSTTLTLTSGGSASTKLIVSVPPSTPPGTYSKFVEAVGGGIANSLYVLLEVPEPAFGIEASPSRLGLSPGGTNSTTVTLTSQSGFAGLVDLALSCPFGISATITPANVTLSSGDSRTSVLSVSASVFTPPGDYLVLVIGAYGSLTKYATILASVESGGSPIDTTVPTTDAQVSPDASAFGWRNGNVTISLAATDEPGGSGVKQIYYSLTGAQSVTETVPGNRTTLKVFSEGNSTLTFYATDNAGNAEKAHALSILIDRTPPIVTGHPDRPTDRNGWYNHSLTVTWVGSDNLDSIVSCDLLTTYSGPDASQMVVSGHCSDQALNNGNGTFNIAYDSTPPVITSPQQGQSFILNQIVSPSATCNDALSGIDTCTVPSGMLDTSMIGPHSYVVTAMDKAGNIATLTVQYSVHYSYSGPFLPPSKTIRQGRNLPIMFSLTDAQGNFVSTATAQIWVDSLTNLGQSAGKSNTSNYFRYDPASNQYVYVLATKNLSVGTHALYITLNDGTVRSTFVNVII